MNTKIVPVSAMPPAGALVRWAVGIGCANDADLRQLALIGVGFNSTCDTIGVVARAEIERRKRL